MNIGSKWMFVFALLAACNNDGISIPLGRDGGIDAAIADGSSADLSIIHSILCGIPRRVNYAWDGGLSPEEAPHRVYSLVPEKYFNVHSSYNKKPPEDCQSELPACGTGDAIDIGDIQRAFAHPDVQAALAANPTLYGEDPRPYDGSILQLVIPDAIRAEGFSVGVKCRDHSPQPCRHIPAGISALVNLLSALAYEYSTPPHCDNSK